MRWYLLEMWWEAVMKIIFRSNPGGEAGEEFWKPGLTPYSSENTLIQSND